MKKRNTHMKLFSILLNRIHPFYDVSGRAFKILSANGDEIIKFIVR